MATIEELLKTKPDTDAHMRAMLNVMYTGHWLVAQMTTMLKPFGISEPQYNVLRILRGQNGASLTNNCIQTRMVQAQSNVSRIIDKLLEKKLVTRAPDEQNRRKVEVSITADGLTLLKKIDPLVKDLFQDMHQHLSEEEATRLTILLDSFRGHCPEHE